MKRREWSAHAATRNAPNEGEATTKPHKTKGKRANT
jgi:hypothetical protein